MNNFHEINGKKLGWGKPGGLGGWHLKPTSSSLEEMNGGIWLRPEPGSRA